MIDFRYHLVSLIAVFLAVALGIVIGTTALNDPISADIEARVADLEQDKRQLEDQTQSLEGQLETAEAFEQAVAPGLVGGTLEDAGVLVIATSEEVTAELVEQVGSLLTESGAAVTGVVRLQPEYTDPETAAELQAYVTSSGLPAGLTLPETDDPGRLVASVLAQSLIVPADGNDGTDVGEPGTAGPGAEGPGTDAPGTEQPGADGAGADTPDATTVSSVLAGLAALDVLSVESDSVSPADFAVVLTAGGFTAEAEERNGTLVELVAALDAAGGGAVVAGTAASAREDALVGTIRADPELSAAISTVDNVDRAAGRISTVLALGQEAAGTSGMYGTGQDTQPVPPVPAASGR